MTRKENFLCWVESIGHALIFCLPLGLCVTVIFYFLYGGEIWP